MNRQQRRHPDRHGPQTADSVAISFPHGHEWSARFGKCLYELGVRDACTSRHIVHHLFCSSGANITNARNEIAAKFLDETDAEWLWMVDTDMTFEPDILDRMVAAADPAERPIMGALCFSLKDGYRACPTLYIIRPDNRTGRMFRYPRGEVLRVLTGTGCLLMHRGALERMRGLYSPAYPWFQESASGDLPIGEDLTFCLRAEAAGIPVHVDTSIKCGHEKPFIVDEEMYDAQVAAGLHDPVDTSAPTFVVIPVKRGEREQMTAALVASLGDVPVRVDDSDLSITDKWVNGWEWARGKAEGGPFNVAFLNNDLEVKPGFLGRLAAGVRFDPDNWVAYPNVHGIDLPDGALVATQRDTLAGQTMSGYAFMVRGEAPFGFDPQFRWWYGDSDLERQVRAAGKKTVCVGGCFVRHLHPLESSRTPTLLAQAKEDEARFAAKWGLDPDTLWLALNPEFGAEVTV